MPKTKLLPFLLVLFYMLSGILNATEYDKTSFYVAYDSDNPSEYVLVMPSVNKVYTHKAGEITGSDLKQIDTQFTAFPTYDDGELCFSGLNEEASGNNGASIMADRCYDVDFFYTQKEVADGGVAFILTYTPLDRVYEGLAGDAKSFQIVKDGKKIHNENSITQDDYLYFIFNPNTFTVYGVGGEKPFFANAGKDFLIHEDMTASFDGSNSVNEDDIVSYVWKEGENVLGSEKTVADIALKPGMHTVTLTITDNEGKESSDSVVVTVNQLPIVKIEENTTNVWGNAAGVDGSESFDPDGEIVKYEWSNGATASQSLYEKLPLGFNTVSLTVEDNDGGVSTGEGIVETIICKNQTTIALLDEVDGNVNMLPNTNTTSCYKINLSSNNGTELYALYMNMYEGTKANSNVDMVVELKDASGVIVKTFSTGYMDATGDRMYQQFDIPTEGKYYLKLYRKRGYATKYGFSIHPSLSNGLVQDTKGELNDFPSMATPLTLVEAQSDVEGSLNMTRVIDSSIKDSDQYDYYEIDFDKIGTFAFYMNLYEGTKANSNIDMVAELKDASGVVIKTFATGYMDATGDSMNEEFTIPAQGKFYLKLYRKRGYAAKYDFTITQ